MVLRGSGVLPRGGGVRSPRSPFRPARAARELSRGRSPRRAARTSACRVAGPVAAFDLIQHRDGSVIESQPGLTERPPTDYVIVGNIHQNGNPLQSPADA